MEFAIDTRLLTPVKAAPLAGLTVSVAQGAYRHNGALRWWGGGAITLTPPGSANQWAWVAIGLDPAAGALVAASGSSVVVSAPLESSTIPAISLSGAIPVAAVRVRNGQTELDEADFEDLRFSLVTVPVLLDDLNNVDTSGASDGEVLTYDSGMWIAQAPSGASFSGDAFDVPYTPTTGGDWTEGAPSDVGDGLDILAARSPGGGGTQDYILIRDEKAQGASSGTFTAGAWRTRDLNTEVADTGGHASVASNQITLAAGTYRVFASAPAYVPDRHQLRLYDITHSVVLAIGQSAYTAYGISGSHHGGVAILSGRFTLTETTVIELQHRAQTTGGTLGFGVEANFTTEVYAQVELWKE